MSVPAFLCRYRSLAGGSQEWVKQAILQGKHYLASPLSFNDPFDSRPNFEMLGSRKQIIKYYDYLLKKSSPEIGRESRRADIRRYLSDASQSPRLPKNIENFGHEYHQMVTANVGVLCLSEVSNELLMWAHYADSHRGVCLVFDGSDPWFAKARPVRYQHDRPTVDLIEDSFEKLVDVQIFTKSDHWAYEKEWRVLEAVRGSGVYRIPSAALVQVILGAQISDEDRSLVRSWAESAAPNPKVFQASLLKASFGIKVSSI